MASKRIQKIEVSDFKGINRSKSADDLPVNVAQVLRDMRITPDGTLKRRQEYDNLYDDRPKQFEHITNNSSNARRVNDIASAGATHQAYSSHRRKTIVVGNSGSTEYTFMGYVEIADSANTHTLYLERATRTSSGSGVDKSDMVGWTNRELIVQVGEDGDDTNDYIEFSMVIDSGEDNIYIAVNKKQDAGDPIIQLIKVTTLYDATFSNCVKSIEQANIETDAAITRDIDLEIDAANAMYMFWGKTVGGDDLARYASSITATPWGTVGSYTTAGSDFYSISLVRDTSTGATLNLYLTYTKSATGGGTNTLKYRLFVKNVAANTIETSGTEGAASATAPYVDAGQPKFYHGACFAIDTDGTKHWLFRITNDSTLAHDTEGDSIATITSSLGWDDAGSVVSRQTGWDFVVKDDLAAIYYTEDADRSQILRSIRITDSTDENYNSGNAYSTELLEDSVALPIRDWQAYFACYRPYEANSGKRFGYIIGSAINANVEVKFFMNDKGIYDPTFAGLLTEQLSIDSLGEPLVNDADGAMSQILILQCDDNKLYKRGSYHWDLLEGQRLVDNSDWESKAETVFGSNAHIWENHGTVRFGAGNAATNQAMWYDYVDRYFFENVIADNDGRQLNYQDHLTRFSRVDPPTNMTIGLTRAVFTESHVRLGYQSFTGQGLWDAEMEDQRTIAFLIAFSYEYDGFQESQLLKQVPNGWFVLGVEGVQDTGILSVALTATGWNYTNANRMNPRVTAINVYMANPQGLFSADYTADGWAEVKEKAKYYRVKRIQISNRKPTGEDAFSNDALEGTEPWVDGDDGTWSLTTFVGYNMWQAALDSDSPVDAQSRLGNALTVYTSTGAGTEIYTKESFVPEGYKYGIAIGGRTYLANMRINGTTRTNRIMASAFASSGAVTPDHLSDFPPNVIDLDYDIQGLSKIGDDVLVAIGTQGLDAFNVRTVAPVKLEDVVNLGTDAPDSVTNIVEGGVGNILRGVLFKDRLGNVRLFDGFASKVISDPIRDDFNNSNRGIIFLDATTAQYKYIPQQRLLFLAYAGQIFVLDFRNVDAGGAQWLDWRFNNEVDAMAVGIDGELFFTDGDEVFVFPQAGTVDAPTPQWVSASTRIPEDQRGILKKTTVDYLSVGAALQPAAFIDSNAAVTNTTSTLATVPTKTRDRKAFRWGTRVAREVKLELHGTSSATDLEIHRIVQEIQIEKKQP
jgi:hypothetical protein